MAKKNSTPAAVAPVVDQLKIDELSLLRLTKAAEKGRAAGMELQLASNTLNGMFQKWLAENEEAKKMNDRILTLQAEIKKAQADYTGQVDRISAELKIDMKEYAYDDETGVLHRLPEAPATTPT
jgi:poly-D-alanine transfer protein DltD